MAMLDFLRGTNPLNIQEDVNGYIVAEQNTHLYEEVNYLSNEVRTIQEDMLRISDAFDNVGWATLDQAEVAEIPLETVKKVSKIARELVLLNPNVKSGVSARIGYVWGKGVTFDGVDKIDEKLVKNRSKVFSPQALEEFERALSTDGNVFLAVPVKEEDNIIRIKFAEIEGSVSNPVDSEEIWLYKREYSIDAVNGQTGVVEKKTVIKYYMSLPYYQKLQAEGKNPPKRFAKFGVEQNYVIQHTTVNRQVGWRWGVPDVMPVIFWAKAYKEYLEDNSTLVSAYSRLAFQVKGQTVNGLQSAAATVMRPATRDSMTGESRNVGGTAILGAGNELSPVAATGSSVDFSKGAAMAAMIAAGLEVPLNAIIPNETSASVTGTESLPPNVLKAMLARQELHTERFLELFEYWGVKIRPDTSNGKKDVQEALATDKKTTADKKATGSTEPEYAMVTWPQIQTDSTKDRTTSLGTMVELGILYKEEARKDALEVFGIAPFKPWDELPKPEDDPNKVYEQEQAEVAFDREQQAASVIAKQGVSGGVSAKGGKQTSNNSARNSRAQNSNNS